MEFHLPSVMFYAFAFLTLFSGVMVISARNPVHSVLFLIFAFFNAGGLFVLLGAEYLAMTLVIVYVGAVAVLFLFVVMMLNINFAEWRAGFIRQLPLGISIALLLFVELGALFMAANVTEGERALASHPIPDAEVISNTRAIGRVLYTDYIYAFQISGLILLVAMIGAIVLTLRHRPGVRRQKIMRQVSRTREESVTLVNVKPGEGASS